MSLQTVGKDLVDLCNQGKNFDVMQNMYADNVISVEANGQETSGKEAVIEKSRQWGEANQVRSEKMDGPFYSGPNEFAVHTIFEVIPKTTGELTRLEEVGVYTVEDDRIVREQFFYVGEH